jgi:hypothetical protein
MAIDIRTDVFHRLQDSTVRPHENEIAAVPDQLGDKLAATGLPLEMEDQDSLPGWLDHIPQGAAADPFAEQEKQGRGRLHATA